MKVFLCSFFVVTGSLLASESYLVPDKLSLGIGKGQGSVDAYRLSLREDAKLDFFKDKNWGLDYQCALNYWENDREDVYAFSVSPILSYTWRRKKEWQPYVEVGIGITYVSEKEVDDRSLGLHFQFEDQFGIGVRYKEFDFSVQYFHYSNASLNSENDGLDIALFNVAYKF